MKFDHAILAVHDLLAAQRSFSELGFRVLPGGEHSSGYTHNALILFADGTYLELMAPTDPLLLTNPPPSGPGNYLFLFEFGEGFAGFAMQTEELDREVQRVRQAGLQIGEPEAGGRRRPDGVELRWRTAMFPDMRLPFLISDDTPRFSRVPAGPDTARHRNGATAVLGIEAVVESLDQAAAEYAAALGVEARFEAGHALLSTGNFEIRLRSGPARPRGELPDGIRLATGQPGALRELHAHGTRLILHSALRV